MATRTRWIFFDVGHTLLDEDAAHRARVDRAIEVLVGHGVHVAVEELWRSIGRASAEFLPYPFFAALAQHGVPPELVEQLRATARYDHSVERLYPGVPALLAKLSSSFKLGLIANQSRGTEQRLRAHGIADHFSVVASSAELGLEKPNPAIFHWALERAACEPEAALMVGDRLDNDVAPAKRLGMRTARVLQGFARNQQPRSPDETPDHTIATVAEREAIAMASSTGSGAS
jgi:HAD superfamily hydrolase (TIGR01549 family)